ncbi:MAG: hypothetical protein ACKOUS_19920 [Alphaproteobacteria bacterium]
MLLLSEISVSRARLDRILGACARPPSAVVAFYRPVGLVHHRDHYFLDVVDGEGNIQGSLAAGEGWAGAMAWTNLHEIRRALRQRQDAFVCLQVGHETLLVDGQRVAYSDPLKGIDLARAPRGASLVEFEPASEPVLVLGIEDTAEVDSSPASPHVTVEVPKMVTASPREGVAWTWGEGKPLR